MTRLCLASSAAPLAARAALLALASLALLLVGCDDDRGMLDGAVLDDGAMPLVDAGPGADGGPGQDAAVRPMSPLVDPDCTDGMFTEQLPDNTVDISDLVAGYDSSNPVAFIEAVLARRYTTGRDIVSRARAAEDCVSRFLRDTATGADVIPQIDTVVHECGHFLDLELGSGGTHVYVINDSPLQLSCDGGNATGLGGMTFERSRIRDDAYQPLRPRCESFPGDGSCDTYATIYLDGDPDDGTFDGGDQGFSMLLEETVQYVNSIAVGYSLSNELMSGGRRTSTKDGILTFLWYVMRYLRMARLDYPSAYAHILTGDGGCWRNAVLTVWGRAWLYLGVTDPLVHLGIDDELLEGFVMDADLLSEIQRLRDAEGCPAP